GAVDAAGIAVVLTSSAHRTGTERVAEVAALPEFSGFDTILNVQGDEPFVPAEAIAGALSRVRSGDDVGTAAAPLPLEWRDDPGRVKVVFDERGRALYFSRARIPFVRDAGGGDPPSWQHLGVYAYRRDALARWVRLPPTPLEEAEQLEQLRALGHGLTIGVARLTAPALPGIDTLDDLRRAEAHWLSTHGVPA
ncbi:MAG: 3-deoxy-manno-octulosonate cytidylyltransferase, partial [Gemmatimonadales bacterium]